MLAAVLPRFLAKSEILSFIFKAEKFQSLWDGRKKPKILQGLKTTFLKLLWHIFALLSAFVDI